MGLSIRPCELAQANQFITELHRHHKRVQGHRFSIRCVDTEGVTRGVAVVGRPVARLVDSTQVLEVTRLCTDGVKNGCSILYAAAARVGKELGYRKIQTYILDSEDGASLVAAGWVLEEANCAGGQWKHTDGKPRRTDQPICSKQRWVKILNK